MRVIGIDLERLGHGSFCVRGSSSRLDGCALVKRYSTLTMYCGLGGSLDSTASEPLASSHQIREYVCQYDSVAESEGRVSNTESNDK